MTRVTSEQRKEVANRARGYCEYCYSLEDYSPDGFSGLGFAQLHILPRSLGGETSLNNLAFSCQRCNNHKYIRVAAYDLMSGETVRLFNPRQDSWVEHFVWSEDFLYVIGLTPTGRATIEALQLNRQNVVNLRRALLVLGEHPPNLTE